MKTRNMIKAWIMIVLPVTLQISTISYAQSSDGPGQSMESLQQYARDAIADSNRKANENKILMTMEALDNFNNTPRLQGWESLIFSEAIMGFTLGMPLDKFIEPYQAKEHPLGKPAASSALGGMLVGILNGADGMEVANISIFAKLNTPLEYYQVKSLDDRVAHLFSGIKVGFLRGQLCSISFSFNDNELARRAYDQIVAQHQVMASKVGSLRGTIGNGVLCARLAAKDGKEFLFSRDGFTMVNLPLIRACLNAEAQAMNREQQAAGQSRQDALANLGLGGEETGAGPSNPTLEQVAEQQRSSQSSRQDQMMELRRRQMEIDAENRAIREKANADRVRQSRSR